MNNATLPLSISDSFNCGQYDTDSSSAYLGGIVGNVQDASALELLNVYNADGIPASKTGVIKKGICGSNSALSSFFTNCFYNEALTEESVEGIRSLSEAQLYNKAVVEGEFLLWQLLNRDNEELPWEENQTLKFLPLNTSTLVWMNQIVLN